jgi:hypothetical protein
MQKVLFASALAIAVLAASPGRSMAWETDPFNAHGFSWFKAKVFKHMQWIHYDGPLYNYGPYNTPGHVSMHIPNPWHGTYIPNTAAAQYAGMGGGFGYGYGAAPTAVAAAPAPVATAPAVAPVPAKPIPPTSAPAAAPAIPQGRPTTIPAGFVLPASYSAVYPEWLLNR